MRPGARTATGARGQRRELFTETKMPYRNGVQFDKTRTYFGFHTEEILFLHSEPWSDSLTANPGQRLTVPDSPTALTALSLTV